MSRALYLNEFFTSKPFKAFRGLGLETLDDLSKYMSEKLPPTLLSFAGLTAKSLGHAVYALRDNNLPYLKEYEYWLANFIKTRDGRIWHIGVEELKEAGTYRYGLAGTALGKRGFAKKTDIEIELEQINVIKAMKFMQAHLDQRLQNPVETLKKIGLGKATVGVANAYFRRCMRILNESGELEKLHAEAKDIYEIKLYGYMLEFENIGYNATRTIAVNVRNMDKGGKFVEKEYVTEPDWNARNMAFRELKTMFGKDINVNVTKMDSEKNIPSDPEERVMFLAREIQTTLLAWRIGVDKLQTALKKVFSGSLTGRQKLVQGSYRMDEDES